MPEDRYHGEGCLGEGRYQGRGYLGESIMWEDRHHEGWYFGEGRYHGGLSRGGYRLEGKYLGEVSCGVRNVSRVACVCERGGGDGSRKGTKNHAGTLPLAASSVTEADIHLDIHLPTPHNPS